MKRKGNLELHLMLFTGFALLCQTLLFFYVLHLWVLPGSPDSFSGNTLQKFALKFAVVDAFLILIAVVVAGSLGKRYGKGVLSIRDKLKAMRAGRFEKGLKLSTFKGELYELAMASEELRAFLKDQLEKMRTISQEFGEVSEQVAQPLSETTQAIEEQASSLEEISASMEELMSVLKVLNERAEVLGKLMKETADKVDEGERVMGELAETAKKAGENASAISLINEAIMDIAEQTNLLALNASIESARAGDAGRGFAVVAEEISKLSDSSSKSAREIERLLVLIKGTLEEVSRKAVDTVDNFKSIAQDVKEVGRAMEEFINSFSGQSKVMDEVSKSVEVIAEQSQQISHQAELLSGIGTDLVGLVHKLKNILDNFSIKQFQNDSYGNAEKGLRGVEPDLEELKGQKICKNN